jgi:hypothetical protein
MHPNFGGAINRNVARSERDGGFRLDHLPVDTVLEVRTANHVYTLVHKGSGRAMISGHPELCPEPVEVEIHGSTWGGSMIKTKFVGRGMHLEYGHPVHRTILTTPIVEIGPVVLPALKSERQWAVALVNRVMEQLREEFVRRGLTERFDRLKRHLTDVDRGIACGGLAAELGMTEVEAGSELDAMRLRFREILRREVATVAHEDGISGEIRRLISVVRS